MNPEYAAWIAAFAKRHHDRLYGTCQSATREMVETFPELKAIPGHVMVAPAGRVEHWWCVTPQGEIVDPTAGQFGAGVGEYIPWTPGTQVRVGRCMNCGEDIYKAVEALGGDRECICSPECHREMAESLRA